MSWRVGHVCSRVPMSDTVIPQPLKVSVLHSENDEKGREIVIFIIPLSNGGFVIYPLVSHHFSWWDLVGNLCSFLFIISFNSNGCKGVSSIVWFFTSAICHQVVSQLHWSSPLSGGCYPLHQQQEALISRWSDRETHHSCCWFPQTPLFHQHHHHHLAPP